ncbi:MAG: hypothetical protein RL398_3528 [Planctomycetota bacterium]
MHLPTVMFSCFLAAGAGYGAATLAGGRSAVDPAAAGLADRVVTLEARCAELQQRLDAVASRSSAATPQAVTAPTREAAATVSPEAVAAAVDAYLRSRGAPVAAAEAPEFDLDRDFAALSEKDFWSDPTVWRRAFAAGRMDDVIARYEAAVKANPKDVDAQMQLAKACNAYVQMDPTKWQHSMRADKAYDAVLAVDEGHWEARFSKAVSYTFWPEFLGKKKAAAEHFGILMEQQEQHPPQEQHVQTYLFLGNMLEAREPARAKEVWERGLRRHPDNAALREKLGR